MWSKAFESNETLPPHDMYQSRYNTWKGKRHLSPIQPLKLFKRLLNHLPEWVPQWAQNCYASSRARVPGKA